MPAAVAIPALIGAAGTTAGALISSHAANNATDAQTNAANQQLGLARDVYSQQRSDLAPYRNLGYGALGNLARWTGNSQAPQLTASGGMPQPGPFDPGYGAGPSGQGSASDQALVAPANAQIHSLTNVFGHAPLFTLGAQGSLTGKGTATVKVIAPDGSVGMVPASRLQDAIKAGGRLG
jgi:hypothetical protein